MTKRRAHQAHVEPAAFCAGCRVPLVRGEALWTFERNDGVSFGPFHEACGPKVYDERKRDARLLRLEPDPPEPMEERFRALGPGGRAALAALWKRPRLRPVAWVILDSIDHARKRIEKGGERYERDRKARDLRRKAPALAGYAPHPRHPGVLVRQEGERPLSFRLASGRRTDTDTLADLREQLRALGVPSRGQVNLLGELVELARPPQKPRVRARPRRA